MPKPALVRRNVLTTKKMQSIGTAIAQINNLTAICLITSPLLRRVLRDRVNARLLLKVRRITNVMWGHGLHLDDWRRLTNARTSGVSQYVRRKL